MPCNNETIGISSDTGQAVAAPLLIATALSEETPARNTRTIWQRREAQVAGDVVEMDNCYQDAEHYWRLMRAAEAAP